MGNEKKIKISNSISEFFTKHYVIVPALVLISSLWNSVIMNCLGKYIGLCDDNGYTIAGIVSTIITLIIAFGVVFVKSVADHYRAENDEEGSFKYYKKGYHLLSSTLLSVRGVCDNKLSKLVGSISSHSGSQYGYTPTEQIELLLKELVKTTSYMLSESENRIKDGDIYASLYYSFDDTDEWICVNQIQQGLPLTCLQNEETTFKYLNKSATSRCVFYNSKEDARKEDRYYPDTTDEYEANNLRGSIVGYKFDITYRDHTYIKANLYLTSYKKQFVDISKKDSEKAKKAIKVTKENLEAFILEEYKRRILIELCRQYEIDHSNAQKTDK